MVRAVKEKNIKRRMYENSDRNDNERKKIYEATAKLLDNNNTSTLSLDDITYVMGSTKGKIYYYFKTKSDLLYQLRMYVLDLAEEAINPILNDNKLSEKRCRH
jgi:AcrR family transcriptional regulator